MSRNVAGSPAQGKIFVEGRLKGNIRHNLR